MREAVLVGTLIGRCRSPAADGVRLRAPGERDRGRNDRFAVLAVALGLLTQLRGGFAMAALSPCSTGWGFA